eukprot:jgi/Botrbrau1/22678/Bobra.0132s0022.1
MGSMLCMCRGWAACTACVGDGQHAVHVQGMGCMQSLCRGWAACTASVGDVLHVQHAQGMGRTGPENQRLMLPEPCAGTPAHPYSSFVMRNTLGEKIEEHQVADPPPPLERTLKGNK